MALYQRHNVWWVDMKCNGERIRESTGTSKYVEALMYEKNRKAELKMNKTAEKSVVSLLANRKALLEHETNVVKLVENIVLLVSRSKYNDSVKTEALQLVSQVTPNSASSEKELVNKTVPQPRKITTRRTHSRGTVVNAACKAVISIYKKRGYVDREIFIREVEKEIGPSSINTYLSGYMSKCGLVQKISRGKYRPTKLCYQR